MSDNELELIMNRMKEVFGESLPNPNHEPKRFYHYAKMYWYFFMR